MLDTTARRTDATVAGERIHSLDTIRGLATLGILLMNAVAFALPDAAYENLDAGGNATFLDQIIGVAGRVFADQKMMALFSLLFGVGIVIFADRAEAKGRRPVLLSLWRNLLLLAIGIVHSLVWDGDILTVYAICAPVVLLMRKMPASALIGVGSFLALSSGVIGPFVNATIPADGAGLGDIWLLDGSDVSDGVGMLLILNGFGRALGLMLVGVGLYRLGVVQGHCRPHVIRQLTMWGLAVGLPLSIAGVAINIATDWQPTSALLGLSITTLATVPLALGYLGAIITWSQRPATNAHRRVQAVGRMALTNYLTQTALGVAVLTVLLDDIDVSRTLILGFIIAVWTLQLAWSSWWLERFRFGPVEWLWRMATYRRRQPIRRTHATPGV